MSHVILQYDGVVTVRLDGKVNAQELNHDLKAHLDQRAGGPVVVLIDLAFVLALGQQAKATLYRALQHHNVIKVGFYGANPDVAAELSDLLPLLNRLRPASSEATEADVRLKLGLSSPPADRKLTGMLAYLKKAPTA